MIGNSINSIDAASVGGEKGVLKRVFNSIADKIFPNRIVGAGLAADDPDLAKRQKAFNDVQQKMRDDEAAELVSSQEGGSDGAGFEAPPETAGQENTDYKNFRGLKDKGDHIKCTGEMTDKQLERVILKGALERGWPVLHFYKGGSIDQQLTQRADAMVKRMNKPDGELGKRGVQVQVSDTRQEKLESWKTNIPGRQKLHTMRDNFNAKAPMKQDMKALKSHAKAADEILSKNEGLQETLAARASAALPTAG